jgi:hypothetical protein
MVKFLLDSGSPQKKSYVAALGVAELLYNSRTLLRHPPAHRKRCIVNLLYTYENIYNEVVAIRSSVIAN